MAYSGFFQFENREDGVYLKAVAEDMSNMPPIDCLIAYCDKKNIPYSDKFNLKKSAEKAIEGEAVRISAVQVTPFAGFAEYSFGEDDIFDDSFTWTLIKTYEDIQGVRFCLQSGKI